MTTDSEQLYSKLSIKLSNDISKETRQKEGIYFSSKNTITQSLQIIQPFLKDNMHILEPSCGTCEFIHHIDNNSKISNCNIDCVEFNKSIYDEIKGSIFKNHAVNIIHANFLTYDTSIKYDLIIGNPPYFVIPKTSVDKKYHSYFTGRPNIFNIFIAKSLDMLDENGNFLLKTGADAQIVQGLMAITAIAVNGLSSFEVSKLSPSYVEEMGLKSSLTPSRANGFLNMFRRVISEAEILAEA